MKLPNIFWFLTDSICAYRRKDKFSRLPLYDELASSGEGFSFEEALSLFPSTFGAVHSMLTGRFPCYVAPDYAPSPLAGLLPFWRKENYFSVLNKAGYRPFSLICYEVGHRWLATVSEPLVEEAVFEGGNQLEAQELKEILLAFLAQRPLPQPFVVFVHFRAGDPKVNENLSQIVAFLRQEGLWDPSIVLISSDHGYRTFQETRNPLHFDDIHVGSLRPAAFLKLPASWRGRFPARRLTERVYTIDFWETILDLLGLKASHPREATSFKALLAGQKKEPSRYVRGDAYFCFQPVRRSFVICDRYKLNLETNGHYLVEINGLEERPLSQPGLLEALSGFFRETQRVERARGQAFVKAAFEHSFLADLTGRRLLLPRRQFPPLLVETLAELLRQRGNTVVEDLEVARGQEFDLAILVFNRLTGFGLRSLKKAFKNKKIKVQKILYVNTYLQLITLKEGFLAFFFRELRRRRALLWKRPANSLLWLFYFPFFFNRHLRRFY